MTVKFYYKCESCGHDYIEQRGADESPFFVICSNCKTGKYKQTKKEILSDVIELNVNPIIEEKTETEIIESSADGIA
jgi:ssDNA-binding Zn-finger/Zn-ribbon topoisomerase 1